MKKSMIVLVGIVCAMVLSMTVAAQDVVTPEEVVLKVREAAAYLEETGEEGLAEFKDPEGPWAWENTYVFVYDCAEGVNVANIFPDVVGKSIEDILDDEGWPVGVELCKAGDEYPEGRWIEYMWREAGTGISKKKISYIYKKPGTKYTLGAGMYNPEGVTIEELNGKLGE